MELEAEVIGNGPPLVLAHGLFGSGRNWRALARRWAARRRVIAVDMRNHGDSPWSDDCGYAAMAGDLGETIAAAGGRADVLGHSMGGKAAMALALIAPDAVGRLIVADIAPVAYAHSHADLIGALRGLDLSAVSRRGEADAALKPAIPDDGLRAFLLQNLAIESGAARWRPNLAALEAGMDALTGWPSDLEDRRWTGPVLALRGARSDYVNGPGETALRRIFPGARVETIADAGHWLHAEKPDAVAAAVEGFLRP